MKKPKLELYYASDRRVYNGAPCSDMNREWQRTEDLMNYMKHLDKTASCLYYPEAGKYLVFTNSNILENPDLVGPPRKLTGNFHISKQAALIEAIETLEAL